MKTDNFCKENRPEAKKKLRLPGSVGAGDGGRNCVSCAQLLCHRTADGGRAGRSLPRKSQSRELNPGTLPSGIHSRAVV